MSYQGSLECVAKDHKGNIGLGTVKPEELTLNSSAPKSKELEWRQVGYSEVTIVFLPGPEEQPEFAVVSADVYELKYEDAEAKDDVSTTQVEYRPEGGTWITLDTAHVYKRRDGIVDISPLCSVEFRVLGRAVPKDKPVNVEVHLATSEATTSASSKSASS